jgi:hypothetical protein
MFGSVFSSKKMGVDEFTDKYYDDDDTNLILMSIPGCRSFVRIPGGEIVFHTSSKLIYDCLNIEYMIDKNCIPISITNLNDTPDYNIKRSRRIY